MTMSIARSTMATATGAAARTAYGPNDITAVKFR